MPVARRRPGLALARAVSWHRRKLAVVAAVASVSSAVSGDVPATSHPLPLTDVYREDVVEPSLPVDDVLAGAPAAQDGRFLVLQILEED